MLRYMERSTIHFLKHKGWTNVQIAEFTSHHRDTIAKVLKEEVDKDKKPQTRQRESLCWLLPSVRRILLPLLRMIREVPCSSLPRRGIALGTSVRTIAYFSFHFTQMNLCWLVLATLDVCS
jgi:hypothetical protein